MFFVWLATAVSFSGWTTIDVGGLAFAVLYHRTNVLALVGSGGSNSYEAPNIGMISEGVSE